MKDAVHLHTVELRGCPSQTHTPTYIQARLPSSKKPISAISFVVQATTWEREVTRFIDSACSGGGKREGEVHTAASKTAAIHGAILTRSAKAVSKRRPGNTAKVYLELSKEIRKRAAPVLHSGCLVVI